MALSISVSQYNFSTGMAFDSRIDNVVIQTKDIISVDAASIYSLYNLGQQQFTNVRGVITVNQADVLKKVYVWQTPAQILALINA